MWLIFVVGFLVHFLRWKYTGAIFEKVFHLIPLELIHRNAYIGWNVIEISYAAILVSCSHTDVLPNKISSKIFREYHLHVVPPLEKANKIYQNSIFQIVCKEVFGLHIE